jgi:uncharacterized protein (TIGR03435 family)
MAAFAEGMTNITLAQQFIGTNPVQDKTGLEGKFDFTFKYNPLAGATNSGDVTLPDALDKQIGLKLEQETITLPVLVVDKARRPSPNLPDVAQKIPPYPTEFEVATIKPSPPLTNGPIFFGIRTQPGGRVEVNRQSLKSLIQQAWSVPFDSIVGGPKFVETENYDIVGKMPASEASSGPGATVDTDAVMPMLRALLTERFKIATHFEDRTMTAYTLTASKPKLKKADPASRTRWTQGSGPIALNANSAPSRTIRFQNMSMAQFTEKLQSFAGNYVHAPVVDGTGLDGGYDFALTYSPIAPAQLATMMVRPPDAAGGPAAADPIGGVSLFDALDKQLGLKLVEQKRPVKVLVIDHIDEKPSDN